MVYPARIKICGIRNLADARLASQLGAWALGFNFYRKSPRYIAPKNAAAIIRQLPPFVIPVGIFVNENEVSVKRIVEQCVLSVLQFHGDEDPAYCRRFRGFKLIKAFGINRDFDFRKISDYPVSAYLLDAHQERVYGGSGKVFDWDLIKKRWLQRPIILSGGLNPRNVRQAFEEVHPYAVDVASGVERTAGRKDEGLLKKFFLALR